MSILACLPDVFQHGRAGKMVTPAAAVKRSELTGVHVVSEKNQVSLRQVRLGEPTGQGEIEILAGVWAREKVALGPVKAGIGAGTFSR